MTKRQISIPSPCIGACDVFDGLCMGCFRDIYEISDWHEMSDDQRRVLLIEIELRRKEHKAAAQN